MCAFQTTGKEYYCTFRKAHKRLVVKMTLNRQMFGGLVVKMTLNRQMFGGLIWLCI